MAGEWTRHKVGDLFSLTPGFAFKSSDFKESGVPVLKIKNVKANSVVLDTLSYVDKGFLVNKKNYVVKHGDILITMSGNRFDGSRDTWVGKIAQFLSSDTYLLNQRVGILRPKPRTEIDPRCCTYILGSDEYQDLFIAIATSSGGQANLSPNQILGADVLLPPIDEQRAIAHILGTLDDKIELNRRMNETLEAIARAIFKSWFVDFDPVRAKMERRDPGLPNPTADLFPDCFEDSELGEIPAGWQVGRLDDVLVLQRGFDLPATERTLGLYPVIAASGPNGTHNQSMVRGPGVTTGRSGVLGNVFYVHDDFWPLNTSLWVKDFKRSTPAYAFHLLRRLDFAVFNAGSAVPTLNRNHVHNLPTLIPPIDLVRVFETVAVLFLKRQRINDDESHTLAALRDTLSPKLISGELRVKDAERIDENVA